MAQVAKTASESEILNWNLWESVQPAPALWGERSRAASTTFEPKVSKDRLSGSTKGGATLPIKLGPVAVYTLLTVAVMLPLLTPGFILTLDMAFTPELRMPEHMSSSYLFHAALHYLNVILPSDVIQKIMLLAILLLSGLGMHLLMRHVQKSKNNLDEFGTWSAYVAGSLYMINPFTYSRFMAGQYAVLLGYALLPFFVRAMLSFFAIPTLRRSLATASWLTVIGIVSIHTLALAAIMVVAALAVCAWRCRGNHVITLAAISYGLISLATFVLASGYWLFPLLAGTSNQAQATAQFGAADTQAFQTGGSGVAGKLGNILQLQGFWAEGQGLYLLPQDQLPMWALVVLLVWILVGIGVYKLWRDQPSAAALFSIAALAAIILAISGAGNTSILSGLREPHKFVGLLAMAYALFAGFGATAVLRWAKRRSELLVGIAAAMILLLPVLFTPTMFWGFAGQLSPRHYPTDWFEINTILNQDDSDFRVLSVPWHLYMHYQFAGRVVVNPSEGFFDKPVITSNELEFMGASPTFPSVDKKILNDQVLPDAARDLNLARDLKNLGIKYVLLAKTFDYKDYAYLDRQADLQLISETRNLKLYRNLAYEQ